MTTTIENIENTTEIDNNLQVTSIADTEIETTIVGIQGPTGLATPAGNDTEVQFNDGGAFGGDANFTWDKTAQELAIIGNQIVTASGLQIFGTPALPATTGGGAVFAMGTGTTLDANINSTNLFAAGLDVVPKMPTSEHCFFSGNFIGASVILGGSRSVITGNSIDTLGSFFDYNTFTGYSIRGGTFSTLNGALAGFGSATMIYCSGFGNRTFFNNAGNTWTSVALGEESCSGGSGQDRTAGGYQSLMNAAAYGTSAWGARSGKGSTATNCLYGGLDSGTNNTIDDRLIFENSNDIITPLIDGSFSANWVKINGDFEATGNITVGANLHPSTMADGTAANNSIYYSSTQSKLVYKDSGGVVNDLY